MSRHDDGIAELIPWVVNGTATPEETRILQSHVEDCAACHELLVQARALQPPGGIGDELPGHPEAANLRLLLEDPAGMPSDLRDSIEAHLRTCGVCREVAEVIDDLPAFADQVSTPATGRSRWDEGSAASPGAGPWFRLGRTMLSPAMAGIYLVLLLAAGLYQFLPVNAPPTRPGPGALPERDREPGYPAPPAEIRGAGPVAVLPPPVLVPGEIRYRQETDEGEPEPFKVSLPEEHRGPVLLLLDPDLDSAELEDPAARFEIRIGQGGKLIGSHTVEGSAFGRDGLLTVSISAEALRASLTTRLEILLRKPGNPLDGEILFSREITVLRQVGSQPDQDR